MLIDDIDRYYDHCLICSSLVRVWATKQTNCDSFRIDRCCSCGYAFVNPRPSMRFLMQYYSNFGHRSCTSKSHMTLDAVMKREEKCPSSSIDAHRIIKTVDSLKNRDLPNNVS